MRYCRFILLSVIMLTVTACDKQLQLQDFDLSDESASFGENNFAVITEKYITSLDIPSKQGITVSQLRYAEVYAVEETAIIKTDEGEKFWVKLAGGWVPGEAVQLYRTDEKAKTASMQLFAE